MRLRRDGGGSRGVVLVSSNDRSASVGPPLGEPCVRSASATVGVSAGWSSWCLSVPTASTTHPTPIWSRQRRSNRLPPIEPPLTRSPRARRPRRHVAIDQPAEASTTPITGQTTTPTSPATRCRCGRPARILVVGDSTAEATGPGWWPGPPPIPTWPRSAWRSSRDAGSSAVARCPRMAMFRSWRAATRCWTMRCPAHWSSCSPMWSILMVTSHDIVPRQWSHDEGVLDPRDQRYVARMRSGYRAITDLILSTTSARIVWIRPPKIDALWLGEPHPFTDPELVEIREGVMADTIADQPGPIAAAGHADVDGGRPAWPTTTMPVLTVCTSPSTRPWPSVRPGWGHSC